MTHLSSHSLQSAIYTALHDDPVLSTEWNIPVIDAAPNLQIMPETYIRIGDEQSRALNGQRLSAYRAMIEITVFSKADGFARAKQAADRVVAILGQSRLAMTDGRMVGLWFDRTQNLRLQNGNLRASRLWFRATVQSTV